MRKKVGILGGTFDPPHLGHLIMAQEVLHRLKLHEIHFMPNQEPPHKEMSSGTTGDDRVRMLELAISGNPAFFVEKIELERSGKSYTVDTIKILQKRNPNYDYYFIIGADMVEYLPNWHKIDELIELVRFVGVNRPNHRMETNYSIITVEAPQIDISSTMIRKRSKAGESAKYLLPESVMRYIEENQLYGS